MVTVKDLGEAVELTILLPIEKRELNNIASAVGYDIKDLKSYGFHVIMKTSDFIAFVEDVMIAHSKMQLDRADAIKSDLDTSGVAQ